MTLLPQPRRVSWTGRWVPATDPVETREPSIHPQGYRIAITEDGVAISASDDAGAFYARKTLEQLARLATDPGLLPEGDVDDWPDIAVRGVMLDVSRDKVPTLETLESLVDRLAGWKINHLQLYMEHTFAYTEHKEVWAAASPYTADDIRRLDAFCRARHVELTPNQNCLGHFERWLKHDRYRPLAIAPDGWTDARGRHRPPTTLDPSRPESLSLVRSLLAELLDAFTSQRVHVGLDEPWELADERFGDYVDYINRLRAAPELDGREMLIWGDIVASHPERVREIADGTTVFEWGYEADHPFFERTRALAGTGHAFWVCPGTSSWNTLVGRTSHTRFSCSNAAAAALEHSASGYLVTDWGDNGHLQYLPVSELGLAHAASVSWCLDRNDTEMQDLDRADHVFRDDTLQLGSALLGLGSAHALIKPQIPNNSILTMHLFHPRLRMGDGLTAGMTDADLGRAEEAIGVHRDAIMTSKPQRPDGDLIKAELDTSTRLLALLVRDARARLAAGGRVEDVAADTRAALAAEVDGIVEEHRANWLARNRPGGLDDSCSRLTNYADVLRS